MARLLVIDDDPITIVGINKAFEGFPMFEVVGTLPDGQRVGEALAYLKPDIVIVDLHLPNDIGGVEVIRRIHAYHAGIGIIALTVCEDTTILAAAVASGAKGCVSKKLFPRDLLEAVFQVSRGKMMVSSNFKEAFEHEYTPNKPLTQREREILKLMAKGKKDTAIAEKLGIEPPTVRSHIQHLVRKLGITHRTESAIYALKYGLISLKKSDDTEDQASRSPDEEHPRQALAAPSI